MTDSDALQILRAQFALTWRLAEHHLPALTDEACLWAPAPGAWTVRRGADGNWRPDWAQEEPSPAPPVTIGWLTWHLIWWWSSVQAAMAGAPPPPREEIFWPGEAAETVRRLEQLSRAWAGALAALEDADLARPCAYPWPQPRPLADTLAWANVELMKNVAEVGAVRHLFEAARAAR